MKKRVLVLCTGNSCRSIIGEALLNAKFGSFVEAFSAGSNPKGEVNPNAKKVLQKYGLWRDSYHSKSLDEVIDITFDLVVTVCDKAKESCPIFPKKTKVIHVGFEDPDGKPYEEFEKTLKEMEEKLLPKVKQEL